MSTPIETTHKEDTKKARCDALRSNALRTSSRDKRHGSTSFDRCFCTDSNRTQFDLSRISMTEKRNGGPFNY